ncbi:phage tail tube protein [Chelatococcus sp. GCM10030263]|uniref:phage tail tube protein n=1 Tax=Chelatococcus sp. GCM10030263 TaxID=3273387 RepID=UPI003617321B
MAKPTTLSAAKLLVMLGDGATPTEAFTAPCGLTTKGISLSAASNDITVPDCDDPDAASWSERVISALSGTVSGSGVLAMESFETWRDYFFSGASKNARVKIDTTLANNGGYFEGKFILTTFNVTGELGNKIQVEIELQNDGEIVWVDASA